jgi:phosphonate transport system ATP-binding protein
MRFAERRVLDGVDLRVRPGEAVALIGSNGAGKSTLLKCLIRLIEPGSGEIDLLGEKVMRLDRRALRRLRSRVGVVWQRHNLVPRLSAYSNVVHGVQARLSGPRGWLHSLAPAAVREEALHCLEQVGLADRALQRADSLSGGQSQRVAIARMLMQRPELVLADEPDASLDPQAGEEVMGLLHDLTRRSGLALVVVSHRLEHATAFSDRIVGLAGGKVAFDVPARSADPDALRDFFAEGSRWPTPAS